MDSAGRLLLADFTGNASWDELDAAGYDGAAFYLSGLSKDASQAFIAEGLRRGRALLPIFEKGGRGNAGGPAQGVAHAQEFRALLDSRGVPRTVPVANAESDYDANPGDQAISGYYRAFHDTLAQPGGIVVYAGGNVGRMAVAQGSALWLWLTCSGGFSGSGDHTGVAIWQRCAGESGLVPLPSKGVDTNIVLVPNIPFWGLTPAKPPEEPLMVTPEDETKIRMIVADEVRKANEVQSLNIADFLNKQVRPILGSIKGWAKAHAIKAGVTPAEAHSWDPVAGPGNGVIPPGGAASTES